MPLPPFTTPVPRPVFMPGISYQVEAPPSVASSSSLSAPPRPSPLPMRILHHRETQSADNTGEEGHEEEEEESEHPFPLPKLRLEIRDLTHPGAAIFLGAVQASDCTSVAVRNVLRHLYVRPASGSGSVSPWHPPPTRSVTLVLRDMGGGVAYTVGSELDDDHKEIHFHLGYFASLPAERHADEIAGVLTHELVHCYQWNGRGSAPGGLIEGIADWVRLNCGLSPPHWKRETTGRWDGGYQHTAYFLQYLEERFGADTVRRVNETLRVSRYEEKAFWTGLLGRPVEQLWEDYRKKLTEEGSTTENGK
ncbi:peptidase of plants and bacteria-domain-containing protein [Xylariales sp. PMI_506]|nr:peptidase of plants and bacteria-domain-containing protein [Xylariales sp. PMI_506]